MQNIDYSRRLRGKTPFDGDTQYQSPQIPAYREKSGPKSPFILLVGAILLFTSGMVVGIQLTQKENKFQEQGEKSFSNLGKKSYISEKESKEEEGHSSQLGLEQKPSDPSVSQGSTPFPSTLKFPPKNDQINYMVLIGDFSPEEALNFGKTLLDREPSLKGRIFRTSTGKLFAGYFYRMDDAKETLEKIQDSFPNLTDAQVKTIRF
ncbi:MAG: hypothetical protein O9301_04450 [Leptospira sp.]|nr:hypothetical protein [Leptospira sp.]